jgi:hypothetical protein
MSPKSVHPDASFQRLFALAPFLAPLPRSSSLWHQPAWHAWSRSSRWCHSSLVDDELDKPASPDSRRRGRLTLPPSPHPTLQGDQHSARYARHRFSQQELNGIFAYFDHIIIFFELVSYIDMKLEFYMTLVFTVLLDCIIQSFWSHEFSYWMFGLLPQLPQFVTSKVRQVWPS